MEGAKGTKDVGASAAGAVSHEGSGSLDAKPSGASSAMPGGLSNRIFDDVETDDEETIYEPSTTLLRMLTLLSQVEAIRRIQRKKQ